MLWVEYDASNAQHGLQSQDMTSDGRDILALKPEKPLAFGERFFGWIQNENCWHRTLSQYSPVCRL